MTKQELLEWISGNRAKYPALAEIRETVIDGEEFLALPVQYGIYTGVLLCLSDNRAVEKLRAGNYAVGVIRNYTEARKIFLECARKMKSKRK